LCFQTLQNWGCGYSGDVNAGVSGITLTIAVLRPSSSNSADDLLIRVLFAPLIKALQWHKFLYLVWAELSWTAVLSVFWLGHDIHP